MSGFLDNKYEANRQAAIREIQVRQARITEFSRNRLKYFRPYPKQYALFKAGTDHRERLYIAANQSGKTLAASIEVACHATGIYPDWWPGRRFKKPVIIWTGSETAFTSKKNTQRVLLGNANVTSPGHPECGTGTIPGEAILNISTRQSGIKNVIEDIVIRHKTGGESLITLMEYQMSADKWTGVPVDFIWVDEVVPDLIYAECLARIQATKGQILATFTPVKGMTDVCRRFLRPDDSASGRFYVKSGIYDAIGGSWVDGPWNGKKWKGHYTKEEADEIVANHLPHERQARAFGEPSSGEGAVFPIDPEDIKVKPQDIPDHWPQIAGLDFGINHPNAGVLLAWDRATDTVYVKDCDRRSNRLPDVHAQWFMQRGLWIPIAWPHDGLNKEKSSGTPLKDFYVDAGANMLPISARYSVDGDYFSAKGGGQDAEPVMLDIYERMQTGRFKVFSHLEPFFDEMRYLHRKDGRIMLVDDDIIKATTYAMMMLGMSTTKPVHFRRKLVQTQLRQWS